ncbi:MAG: DUF2147 domain-containing protein [Prevotellaceae bacterium]|jgi:uncharacterized protein (DUF2147 family)|nr:DUF2147 domain-containing protein [Prevotellaceae bacterium]
MKTIILLTIFYSLTVGHCFTQNKADAILGYYLSPDVKSDDKTQLEIYKTSDGKYAAKVVWTGNKAKRHLVGTIQIKNLTYNPKENLWDNGKVVYEGGEYSVTANISEPGKLKLRGYLGISLFGKTIYWTKEKALRKE